MTGKNEAWCMFHSFAKKRYYLKNNSYLLHNEQIYINVCLI